jgi:hypothetical protein
MAKMLMKTSTSKVGESTHKINYSLMRVKGFRKRGRLQKG